MCAHQTPNTMTLWTGRRTAAWPSTGRGPDQFAKVRRVNHRTITLAEEAERSPMLIHGQTRGVALPGVRPGQPEKGLIVMMMQKLRVQTMAVAFAAMSAAAVLSAPAKAASDKDIVDTAVGAGQFNTLVTAVKQAGLVETLKGKGPFTVFAPTDAAFEKLPDGTVESLLKPENKEKLTQILTYHVVPGKVMAADLKGKTTEAETVEGSTVSVDGTDGVTVNGAKVVKADVTASNGVIHAIDTVLMPKK